MKTIQRKAARRRVHRRIRKSLSGTPARPRLAVHFSNQHVYAQIIDDLAGKTLVAASTAEKEVEAGNAASCATASKVGELVASRAIKAGIEAVVFDRGGFLYHGKVKALADAARSGGLKF